MHQFGHVYALQQELLAQDKNNWMRAVELWHVARHEGIALNNTHYTNILRQCVRPAAWEQSLQVLQQMRRDALRPDVVGVACAMAACADAGAVEAVEALFNAYTKTMKLDSQCYLALMKAYQCARRNEDILRVGQLQEAAAVPFLPSSFVVLIEAGLTLQDEQAVYDYVVRCASDESYAMPRALEAKLLDFAGCSKSPLRASIKEILAISEMSAISKDEPLHLPLSSPRLT